MKFTAMKFTAMKFTAMKFTAMKFTAMKSRKARLLIACIFVVLAPALASAPAARAQEQQRQHSPEQQRQRSPNVVVLLADDLGYGDLGAYGADDIATPNLDRLAAQGVRFTSFYANAPICTPTRAALLTGRYPQRVGGLETAIGIGGVGRYNDAVRLAAVHELGLPQQQSVLPARLGAAGYNTAIIGKWHLGYEPPFRPLAHGFDFALGLRGGGVDYFRHTAGWGRPDDAVAVHHDLWRNGREHFRGGYYLTDLITDESVAWLNQQRSGRPFFLYVPYTAPHSPYQGPDDYEPVRRADAKRGEATRATYAEMVEAMDRGVGKVLAKLEEMGLSENTVVIFFSDNGPTSVGSPGPFLHGGEDFYYKGKVFEGGIRVPLVVRWPGHFDPGTVSDQVAISMDLTASILRIAGAEAPEARPLDGIDLLARVEEGKADSARTLFWRHRRHERDLKAVRAGEMKYIHNKSTEGVKEYLFNLRDDPAEQHNLAEEQPEELRRLRERLLKWQEEVQPVR